MRASDLQGKPVVTEGGERLGRVDELHLKDGALAYFTCGRGGYLQRFMSSRRGRRIDWTSVRRLTGEAIVVEG